MDEYQYPLFFGAKALTDTEMKMVRIYFQTRRLSGGGDCAAIQNVGVDIYKICFKDKEDQKRVFQKKLHMISLPSGERHLTMSQTDSSKEPDQPLTLTLKKKKKKRNSMRRYDPDLQNHSPMIAMEGHETGKSFFTQLYNLKKQVSEKGDNLYSDLIAFKKSREAISKHVSFKEILVNPDPKVESDLVLSSLSSKAMVEAEEAVKRNRIVKTVKLQGTAAEPPDVDRVKEMLVKAKNVANSGEIKVDFSFIPVGTTMMEVRLVGYSENVNQLEKVLCDYQMNQAPTQESLNLPFPELVDCLDEFLHLIGLDHTKLTLKTSTTPNPCVLLSGPRCHVVEVNSALSRLTSDTLVLDGPGAQQYFQAEGKVCKDLIQSSCQVLIKEHPGVNSDERSYLTPFENIAANKTYLQIKFGRSEDQQVNVLVVPMLHKKLTSTKVGNNVLTKSGNTMQSNFDAAAANCTINPGDVLQVAGPPSLGCNKIFFIECLPWDGVRGRSEQALRNGLRRCLDLCVQQGLSSVAFPVIGPGKALGYPLSAAIEALTQSIYQFGSSGVISSLSNIYVVIKPDYPDSECYHAVYRSLSSNMNQGGQVIFRSPTNVLPLMVVPGVRLHVVFGDITNETTDAIVNSTNFKHLEYGVCKAILTVAGPAVTAQLKAAKVNRGSIFQTEGGSFPCKAILHVCGLQDAGLIESLVRDLILHCESSGYRSIAIPAICAGQCGMDAGVVAQAVLRGVKTAASSTPLRCVTDIRLVLIDDKFFLLFREEALKVFSTDVVDRVSLPHEQPNPQRSGTATPIILSTSFYTQQSVFLFLGFCGKNISDAKMKLKQLYQDQCLTHIFTAEEVGSLSKDDILCLQQLVDKKGLKIQSVQGNMTVSGLKDEVNSVIKEFLCSNLRRQVIVREEEDLHSRVAWCILGSRGNWARLPKTANYRLEHNNLEGGIMAEQSSQWTVDLQRMEARGQLTGEIRKIKRLENLPDFTLPLYWDNMAAGEDMKVVTLQESSAEYRSVEQAFRRTVSGVRIKIERLQNVHLRRAYEAQKKCISDKNAHVGTEVEKVLYHGTTQDSCDSIMKTGFNRSFSGKNATVYGEGTYFAVNANFSAQPKYARPAVDGSQQIFVARVLTGIYTVGRRDMKVPPPRDILLPHDRYDSVVDRMDNPSMHVVFHDNQAYPDYLITILGRHMQDWRCRLRMFLGLI